MKKKGTKADPPVAIVCGSNGTIASAVVARLHAGRSVVVTIDQTGSLPHPLSDFHHTGNLEDEASWLTLAGAVVRDAGAPGSLIYALPGPSAASDAHRPGRSELFCHAFMPFMPPDGGSIVVLASVFGGWDHRPDLGGLAAESQARLALVRSLALLGGPGQIRVNAVCYGLVVEPGSIETHSTLERLLARVPLPTPTQPEDVANAVHFLLGPDAAYITGSTVVVDGGQTLQSWSNAPEVEQYPRGGRS